MDIKDPPVDSVNSRLSERVSQKNEMKMSMLIWTEKISQDSAYLRAPIAVKRHHGHVKPY